VFYFVNTVQRPVEHCQHTTISSDFQPENNPLKMKKSRNESKQSLVNKNLHLGKFGKKSLKAIGL
jgi:hypothetical protein